MARLTFRQVERETGLAAVTQDTRGCDLMYDGETLAHIRPKSLESDDAWYWYSLSELMTVNTAHIPTRTLEEAKRECREAFRIAMARRRSNEP